MDDSLLPIDFYATTQPKLEKWLIRHKLNPCHSKALFKTMYPSPHRSTGIREHLPRRLLNHWQTYFSRPNQSVSQHIVSPIDGSVKLVIALKDQKQIETIIIPEKGRITLCVSSQVGCALGCSFCQTGRMGLTRNLTAGEIVSQIMLANQWIAAHPEWSDAQPNKAKLASNIVFMGMGEPLDNFYAIESAIKIIVDPHGLGIAPRKITVSTAGLVSGIEKFTVRNLPASLAWSLHAPKQKLRNRLMPISRENSIEAVIGALGQYQKKTKKSLLIQYTLIKGVNDSVEYAHHLANLLDNLSVKINLIPLNPITASTFSRPEYQAITSFRDSLTSVGIKSFIRWSKGLDTQGACGQLAL